MAEGGQPGRGLIRSRGAIIGLLTGLNLFNYLDRYIVTAVSPSIQDAFRLSNLRTGLSALSMPLQQADTCFGRSLAIVGLLGTALGGWLADRMTRSDPARDALRFCAAFTLPAVPCVVVCLLASTPAGFFLAFCVTGLLLFASTAPLNSALLGSVPPELRAQGMALSIFATHLLGDLLSPPLIGLAADRAGDVRSALLFLIPAAIAASGMFWWWGSKSASLSPGFSTSPE